MNLNQRSCHLKVRATFGALALLLGVMLADSALAEDGKEYPGSMCKEGTDGYHQIRASGDVVFDTTGNALNISTTSSRYVTCPLVRDNEGGITYAAVSIYKPSSASFMCTLMSNPYFGGQGWYTTKKNTAPAGLHLLEFDVQADTFIPGSYNLWCLLPKTVAGKKSGIYHYGIVEAGGQE